MNLNMEDKFAILILTHGRAEKVVTVETLRKQGYTGDIYIVIDDEDEQGDLYREKFGDKVITFSKSEIAKEFDVGDNFNDKAAVVYARNAAFKVAKDLGLDYFLELDDDYTRFDYRMYQYGNPVAIKNLDDTFKAVLDFFKRTPAVDIAIAQGGDFIGGKQNSYATNPALTRKCMNTHFLSPNRPFTFLGKINEDVNTPVFWGSIGKLFFTIPFISVTQLTTQQNEGGLTDIYLDKGTYVKSFYSVMYHPSSCKVASIKDHNIRLHHRVRWGNAVPKILSPDWKK